MKSMNIREKTGRTVRGIFYVAGITVLLGLSCIAGISIERQHQKILEMQREHVSTIAVVNMDDGVTVDHELINYASQLMNFPGENFTAVGLTDARTGIENGTYAAYIIIPETFSVSVTSIENDPRKTVLEYQYNPNLAETARVQAINDVNAFIAMMNSNIAYMYVDAVLTEFHRIQDDSSTILSNDNAELELLENVNAALLIEAAERVEEAVVDNDIQTVELDSYTAQNDSLLDSMLLRYMEAVQQAQTDYAAIQGTRNEVNAAADEFFSVYHSVIYDTNAEQADILAEGRTKLVDAVGLYNMEVDEQREEVERLISELVNDKEVFANEQLNNILAEINADREVMLKEMQDAAEAELEKSLESYQAVMEDRLEEIVEKAYEMGYAAATAPDNNDAPGPEEYIEELKAALEEQIKEITIDWEKVNSNLTEHGWTEKPEDSGPSNGGGAETAEDADGDQELILGYHISLSGNSAGTADEIMELFRLEYNAAEIENVIQICFVDRLREVHQGQIAKLDEAEKVLNQRMNEYEARLESYDPMTYIQTADLGAYLENIEVNAKDMLGEVEQNNMEYRTYAEEVYFATSEHTSQLVDSLNAANTQTTANIESCIDELKLSRLTINGQNVDMLERFTEALAYTRVGSQDNVEVYDYIVNPVISRTSGQDLPAAETADAGQELPIKALLVIFLGIGIAACLAGILSGIRAQRRKPNGRNGKAY